MKEETRIFTTLFVIVIIIGGLMILFSSKSKQNQNQARVQLNPQAKIEIPLKSADLGNMKVSDEKSADFEIKNTGTQILKIYRIFTSCDCTFAKIFINGKESPEFNMEMHNTPEAARWEGEVMPNATATLKIIYKPAVMPVFGPVERSVILSTNDPNNQQVQFDIKALVVK